MPAIRLPVRPLPTTLAAALMLPLVSAPAAAQQTRTLAEMERQYPRLASRHIQMCDRNGDGLYSRAEQACVNSVDGAMRDNNR